jgi:dolichyl-diphosphooligosaccharide--protein glycosyltransferase
MIITITLLILRDYIYHSNQYSAENLSSPSIILSHGHKFDGSLYIYDDFREAYYWLKQNTDKKSKILSWWDYGYQITGMSNRTVIVDNNTWNNTHIATVGKFLQSNEEDGYEIA